MQNSSRIHSFRQKEDSKLVKSQQNSENLKQEKVKTLLKHYKNSQNQQNSIHSNQLPQETKNNDQFGLIQGSTLQINKKQINKSQIFSQVYQDYQARNSQKPTLHIENSKEQQNSILPQTSNQTLSPKHEICQKFRINQDRAYVKFELQRYKEISPKNASQNDIPQQFIKQSQVQQQLYSNNYLMPNQNLSFQKRQSSLYQEDYQYINSQQNTDIFITTTNQIANENEVLIKSEVPKILALQRRFSQEVYDVELRVKERNANFHKRPQTSVCVKQNFKMDKNLSIEFIQQQCKLAQRNNHMQIMQVFFALSLINILFLLGHDQFEEIKYYENDNPLTLAQIFSQKYNMSQAHIDILAQQLAQRIEEEQLQKLKVREQIKQQVLRDIEQDAKEYTLRSKSRKSFRNGPSNNDENMQQQQVYNRLYNIAVVKQQKQQQILQERKSLEQQNRTLSANRSMARSNTMRSFTSQGFNTSQSRIQSFCGTMNSSTQQSFINNQIHYSGSYGDRILQFKFVLPNLLQNSHQMFLMQTKKQELKSMHDEMNSILKNTEFYDSHNNSINKNSNLDQTYLSTMLHQKLNQSQNHRSAHNHSQNTFIASYNSNMLYSITILQQFNIYNQFQRKNLFNSKFLCENRPMSPPEEILLDYGKKYQKNLELKKQQQEQYELDKCTFKPVLDEKRLNKYLQNSHHNRNLSQNNSQFCQNDENQSEVNLAKKNLYEILYSDDKVRQNKFQEIQNQIQQGIKLQQNRATLSKERSPVTQIQEITERVTNQVLA